MNETVLSYQAGSQERSELLSALSEVAPISMPMIIGGRRQESPAQIETICPHDFGLRLGNAHLASDADIHLAITSCIEARRDWQSFSQSERISIFRKAADLLAGPWRQRFNAVVMAELSKTVYQAEIDTVELIDFWRFNALFLEQIYDIQPYSPRGVRNQVEYRPLEGFVYAVTPFNFAAIAGNLATAPAMAGNCVVWKPSPSAMRCAQLIMNLLAEAGLPDGVINLVYGDAEQITDLVLSDDRLAGVHFTGSTKVFQALNRKIAERSYRTYPRLVGETGGKNFILAHASADPAALSTAIIRGAFEYQGQKCSAASRVYVPQAMWSAIEPGLLEVVDTLAMGNVFDLHHFMGSVINKPSFERLTRVIADAAEDPAATLLTKRKPESEIGYFVPPLIYESSEISGPFHSTEFFGPICAIHPYAEEDFDALFSKIDRTSDYGLTGAVFALDRSFIKKALSALTHSAGNFYINDKPTGAIVGQQPFGGGRLSGTNDKAGSMLNMLRWLSPRTIKETYVPQKNHVYPSML